MLSATKGEVKNRYVVKYGYVYSDSHGNHYKPGDMVMLTAKEYSLAAHRVSLDISETRSDFKDLPKDNGKIYRSVHTEIDKPEDKPKSVHEEPIDLSGILGRGKYEVK